MAEHLLRMNKGDIALVITQKDGWFQKISVAYADEEDLDPLEIDPNWLSLYKATTHLSLVCDTYLRTRQSIMQESDEDIFQLWDEEDEDYRRDPEVIRDMLDGMGYSIPAELQEDLEEIKKQNEVEKESKGNIIQFPIDR